MTKQTILLKKNQIPNWSIEVKDLLQTINKFMESKKSCLVTIENLSEKKEKSYKQLRGFHRLINILVSYFVEWTGENWDMDKVKDYIKIKNGFTVRFNGIESPKSCKEATIKDMMSLIKEVEKFAAEMGIEDCYLSSEEEKQLIEYYNER